MQRLRTSFSRGEELKFLSHLDLMRLWERAFRRAGISLASSEGFTPHPRISLAAPLSVGTTGQAELMDVFLSRWTSPDSFVSQIKKQLPRGMTISDVRSVGLSSPSLQSQVSFAEYHVQIETEMKAHEVESAIKSLLSAAEIPWQHLRDTGVRHYDLRPLVDDLWRIELHGSLCTLGMRLRCSSNGTGRPEQVTKALGFPPRPRSIHRTRLILS
jgi:radical SAM-linked protein